MRVRTEPPEPQAFNLVAQATQRLRRLDQLPPLVDAVRRARRALPGDQSFGDPLSVSGEGGARAVARVADRMFQDQPGASREIGFAALQVWQALREWSGRGAGESEVTLVFTDLVDFSTWALKAGDESTLALLRAVASAVEPEIVVRGGRVVKRMGDGLMADFPSPDRAIAAVQAALAHLADVEMDGYQPVMRVGIHSGYPRRIGDDWLGIDVNIAARMMESAREGEVVVSGAVLDALDADWLLERGLKAKDHRRFFLNRPRGVPDDVRMFRLVRAYGPSKRHSGDTGPRPAPSG